MHGGLLSWNYLGWASNLLLQSGTIKESCWYLNTQEEQNVLLIVTHTTSAFVCFLEGKNELTPTSYREEALKRVIFVLGTAPSTPSHRSSVACHQTVLRFISSGGWTYEIEVKRSVSTSDKSESWKCSKVERGIFSRTLRCWSQFYLCLHSENDEIGT